MNYIFQEFDHAIIFSMIFKKIDEFAGQKCGLKKDQLILAAVSGGPDSLCLLDALHRAGYSLVVAHFNHQLRAEAAGDADFVEKLAHKMGLPFVLGSAPVQTTADELHLSIEEAARMLRYRFLFDQAHRFSAHAVVTGHTADDQVETVLMHFIRGAGLAGLKGMQPRSETHGWDATIALARPLLATWREETEAYCTERDLFPRQDITNEDQAYRRNRIRHELIPLLETYNPRIRQTIYRTSTILTSDYNSLVEILDNIWQTIVVEQGANYVSLSYAKLQLLTPGLLSGIIRKGFHLISGGLDEIDQTTVEDAAEFIFSPSRSKRKSLSNGLWIRNEDDCIYLYREETSLPNRLWPQFDRAIELVIDAPGRTEVAGGWVVESALVDDLEKAQVGQSARDNQDKYQAWLDFEQLKSPLILRTRRRGDRWQPLGMKEGTQKLSDFFINAHCPTRARDHWPLICSENQIAWIPGYRPAQSFRLRAETRRILHISLKRVKPE